MTTDKLKFFPITFFSSVMGLAGYTIALTKINEVFALGLDWLIAALTYLVTVQFGLVLLIYLLKLVKHPTAVKQEFHHPIKIHFTPTISISILIISVLFQKLLPNLAFVLWAIGSVLHLILLLYIVNKWIFHDFQLNLKNPSWFIPALGTILVPIAGTNFSPEISWFFYSIGMVMWLPLFTILLYRLFFAEPMPAKLWPTLTILLAPPAVGFLSYIKLVGNLDAFAKVLFYFGIFSFLLILSLTRKFVPLPLFMSWWAYTFPLAAFTTSVILYYQLSQLAILAILAIGLFLLTTLVVLLVLTATIINAWQGKIFVED